VTARDLIGSVRQGWLVVLMGVLLGLAVAAGISALTPVKYAAVSTLYVSAQVDTRTDSAYQSGLLSEDRVKSYTRLLSSSRISQEVIQRLSLSETIPDLQKTISASSTTGTVLIDVTTTASSPQEAVAVGNAVSDVFTQAVVGIEQPLDPTQRPTVTARVFQRAMPVAAPVQPRWALNLLLGLILGALAGAGGAVVRSNLDTSVRSPEQLQKLGVAPVLSVVPEDDEGTNLLEGAHRGPRAEALRRLRTNLQFTDVDRPRKVVVVTSANSSDGKTSTTLALAGLLAHGGHRVVVVEGDLRMPTFSGTLGMAGDVGLTTHLAGHCAVEDAVQFAPSLGAHVILSGQEPPNPSEMLGSARMSGLVQRLSTMYEYVLVDAPPILAVADAAVLASLSDGVALVVRHGSTSISDVNECVDAIKAVNGSLLGFVVNRAPRPTRTGYNSYVYGRQRSAKGLGTELVPPALRANGHRLANGQRPTPVPRNRR